MAKLAVLTSAPRILTMHWPFSSAGGSEGEGEGALWHGVIRSESSTPRSLASCSRVMGMNAPGGKMKQLVLPDEYCKG